MLQALSNPFFDLQRFGRRFVASPRHADVPTVSGPVMHNMAEALRRTDEATPAPKWVIAIGDCAQGGGCFAGGHAVAGGVEAVLPVDLPIPGCPPDPVARLQGLRALFERLGGWICPVGAGSDGRG